MRLQVFGAILIIAGCGSLGVIIASSYKHQERILRQFIGALMYMECDLQYRLTPLPELCRCTAAQCTGNLQQFFKALVKELEDQISPDVDCCVKAALQRTGEIPELTREAILLMGKTLGRFDAEGQLRSLTAVRQECNRKLNLLEDSKESRLRNYRTLGLCSGAALVILFI